MKDLNLIKYLKSHLSIDDALLNQLFANCETLDLEKNEYLLRNNEICKYIYFVENGLLRQFYIDKKGKEHVLYFAPENWFITDRESLFFDEKSIYNIQALEPSKVLCISKELLKNIAKKIPNFHDFNDLLLHKHIGSLQLRIMQLISQSAEERYMHFVKKYKKVYLRIPQNMLASYLGIAPESLSRIRKDLAQKNCKITS
ncbi:Crp/Fnr family transcriptional regulator [Ornithobacterium rhinotracheale]|uniref:Crp/Fnr family transcriptional regulator n=1 Tax=Ornithobacterium rhinotracheale TaxID=28251 RepID=UPI00129CAF78|nr:Crp/Fnr family transcriptional regulator [Ornithobacterium rhinotracheale]MRJ08727.1 Crp/Fnr family transcriptional regulator [Ornithobacterium rhinotracheale]UOH77129.1 Crp/Fnr family transcriptional regulator [Ornithobacterium rhinotracheale]